MNIAYFVESLPPNTDGVAHVYRHLGDFLYQKENVSFRMFSPFKPGKTVPWEHQVTQIRSVSVPGYSSYRLSLPFFQDIRRELDRFHPDLVHVSSPTPSGWRGLRYAKTRGLPAVAAYHTHFASYLKQYGAGFMKPATWRYLRYFYNKFDAVLVPCRRTKQLLEERGFQGLRIWRRGVETDRFTPAFRSRSLRRRLRNEKEPILLFVGRLAPEKNLQMLVEMHRRLQSTNTDHRLAVVGDGPLRDKLEKKLPEAAFPGFLQGKALSRWYASADVFVFPSTSETFGNVVLEAAASGLPSVVANSGGVVNLVKNGRTGFLTRPDDPEDFTKHVEMCARRWPLRIRMSQEALQFARNQSWDQIHQFLMTNYKQLTGDSRTARNECFREGNRLNECGNRYRENRQAG